jgi:hypothetical protein
MKIMQDLLSVLCAIVYTFVGLITMKFVNKEGMLVPKETEILDEDAGGYYQYDMELSCDPSSIGHGCRWITTAKSEED